MLCFDHCFLCLSSLIIGAREHSTMQGLLGAEGIREAQDRDREKRAREHFWQEGQSSVTEQLEVECNEE